MIVEYPRDEGDPYYPIPSDETRSSTSATRRWPSGSPT